MRKGVKSVFMEYVVSLVSDTKTNMRSDISRAGIWPQSFDNARDLLKEFVDARGGTYVGWFNYKGEFRIGEAVVDITETTADQLQDLNEGLPTNSETSPFVARIEGNFFDIAPKEGIQIFPTQPKSAECTI